MLDRVSGSMTRPRIPRGVYPPAICVRAAAAAAEFQAARLPSTSHALSRTYWFLFIHRARPRANGRPLANARPIATQTRIRRAHSSPAKYQVDLITIKSGGDLTL